MLVLLTIQTAKTNILILQFLSQTFFTKYLSMFLPTRKAQRREQLLQKYTHSIAVSEKELNTKIRIKMTPYGMQLWLSLPNCSCTPSSTVVMANTMCYTQIIFFHFKCAREEKNTQLATSWCHYNSIACDSLYNPKPESFQNSELENTYWN